MAEIATITPKQRAAIAELLTSANVTKAAEAAGVTPSTVYRWRTDAAFIAELQRLQRQSLDDVMLALHQLTRGAVNAYIDALKPEQSITHRLRAANQVFDHLLRLRDTLTLESRIEALEAAIHAQSER